MVLVDGPLNCSDKIDVHLDNIDYIIEDEE